MDATLLQEGKQVVTRKPQTGGVLRAINMLRADGVFSLLQGGFGIMEEMCVNYVHYYPQTKLELCKSAVDDGFLQKYFHIANR